MSGKGKPAIDLTGQRFGRWTVLKRGENYVTLDESGKHAQWWCRCDCGTVRLVASASLRRGRSTSCGCRRGHDNKAMA